MVTAKAKQNRAVYKCCLQIKNTGGFFDVKRDSKDLITGTVKDLM